MARPDATPPERPDANPPERSGARAPAPGPPAAPAPRVRITVPTLQALCAHGGHKAETARTRHLNRQALYNRLARIEELLGVDLSDPDQLLTLQLALRARDVLR